MKMYNIVIKDANTCSEHIIKVEASNWHVALRRGASRFVAEKGYKEKHVSVCSFQVTAGHMDPLKSPRRATR